MNEIFLWIIVVLSLLLFGVVLYLIMAVPKMFYQKKEIKSFSELARKFNFEEDLGKAGLKPNFPIIQGFHNRRYFVVRKALNSGSSVNYDVALNRTTYLQKWYIKISTKLKETNIEKFSIMNKTLFKKDISINDFYDCFKVETVPADLKEKIITDAIKSELINVWNKTGFFNIFIEDDLLYTSNSKGLTRPKDVESCKLRIHLLSMIANEIH